MYKKNKYPLIIFIVSFFYGCETSKDIFYSYELGSYTIDTVKHFITSSSLITYGDYLFEFRKRINIDSDQHGESEPIISSIEFDTISVYLLKNKSRLYYEFDTFALKNNIVRTGNLVDKQFGAKFTNSVSEIPASVLFKKPTETLINNVKCFYSEVISKDYNVNDTVEQKMMLIKNGKFNSLYKINGMNFTDKDYCIVGVSVYDLKQKKGFSEEIKTMRPLTEKEKIICANMVMKSKICIVDTIQGFSSK